jgi:CBS domain-containing protein
MEQAMRVHELMTKEPSCATTFDSAQDVARLMADNDIGIVPVVDDRGEKRLVGVVTDRDIAVRGVARGMSPDTSVGELMTRDIVSVDEDADITEVERLMSDRQIRRVVVANADGCCLGVVSQADLARAAGRASEVHPSDVGKVVEHISQPSSGATRNRAASSSVPRRSAEGGMPRFGSAGSGGAEFEPGPSRD